MSHFIILIRINILDYTKIHFRILFVKKYEQYEIRKQSVNDNDEVINN
jgi:hypothetical protein